MDNKNLLTRIKHLRGKHDQLDHAWNRGMGQGGYGAGLAPNQMGPLPTENFYRKRLTDLTEQRRRGEITRAEMRRQMRELRGITLDNLPTQSSQLNDNLILANRNPVKRNQSITNSLRVSMEKISERRNDERPIPNIDITPYVDSNNKVGEGASGVIKTVLPEDLTGSTAPSNDFYYRRTPIYAGSYRGRDKYDPSFVDRRVGEPIEDNLNATNWLPMPSFYMPLAADQISTALGLDIAPVASMTNAGRVLSNSLTGKDSDYAAKFYNDLKEEYDNNPSQENFEKYTNTLEPFIVMTLITGNVDVKPENLWIAENTNPDYGADQLITTVDYDYTGGDSRVTGVFKKEEPILAHYFKTLLESPFTNGRFISESMRQMLDKLQFGNYPTQQKGVFQQPIPRVVADMLEKRAGYILSYDKLFKQQQLRFQSLVKGKTESVQNNNTDSIYRKNKIFNPFATPNDENRLNNSLSSQNTQNDVTSNSIPSDSAANLILKDFTDALFEKSMKDMQSNPFLTENRKWAIRAQITANALQRAIATDYVRYGDPKTADDIQKALITQSRVLIEELLNTDSGGFNYSKGKNLEINDFQPIWDSIEELINKGNYLVYGNR